MRLSKRKSPQKNTEMPNADKKLVFLNAASCVICVGVCVVCALAGACKIVEEVSCVCLCVLAWLAGVCLCVCVCVCD